LNDTFFFSAPQLKRDPLGGIYEVIGASMRVRIDYSDQNEAFAPLLPVAGELERLIPSPDKRKWWIVKLDKPLEYQRKIGEPFRYQLVRAEFLVVGSRWQGYEIGESEPTSVHILVPLGAPSAPAAELDPSQYDHVAWGMCTVEDAA